jgi:hypothetical protein
MAKFKFKIELDGRDIQDKGNLGEFKANNFNQILDTIKILKHKFEGKR